MIQKLIKKHLEMMEMAKSMLQVASIVKKLTLTLIGLFLLTHLLVHLGINLCLLRNDGGLWFREAAHFMGSMLLIKISEFVLLGAIALHILVALFLQFMNWRARPIGYAVKTKSKTQFGSKLMIWSGLVIAVFFVFHIFHNSFTGLGWPERLYATKVEHVQRAIGEKQFALSSAHMNTQDPSELAILEAEFVALNIFIENNERFLPIMFPAQGGQRWITDLTRAEMDEIKSFLPNIRYESDRYAMVRDRFSPNTRGSGFRLIMYMFVLIAVFLHLFHAFPSALQTLGMAHSKYTWIIRHAGTGLAAIITLGFAIIPLYFYFIY